MKILRGILSDSKVYYEDIKRKIEAKLVQLPSGSIKERSIAGHKYYYLQKRVGGKVIHKYIGRVKPDVLIVQLKKRKLLQSELKQVKAALVVLKRAEGRKSGKSNIKSS